MIVLQVNDLMKAYGAEVILQNIKLEVQDRDRIALVGRNGAGKSTLLKIIAGQLSYDSGDIIQPKGLKVGYLAQDTGLESSLSIWDEMMTVFADLHEMEAKLRQLERQMGDEAVYSDAVVYERLLKEYDQLQIDFRDRGGYQFESDIRSVLHGLNFADYDYTTTMIASLSGGQKTRLALAKLLLTKPDLLIMDEPTNHLDIDTLSWLEQYLQGYPGAILIVSHDRYFLDKIVTLVYEVAQTTCRKYHGNYSKYLQHKAEQYERDLKLFEKQQDEVSKLRDFIQRNIARASTTKRAQSRQKQLNRMELMTRPTGDDKSASFSFDIERQSGNDVLKVDDLALTYDGETAIAANISWQTYRGDSIALVGPNGVGKSTLLKSLVGELQALRGQFSFGSNVTIGYYDQQQAKLTSNKRVIDELWDENRLMPEKDVRTILGNFLFSGDDVQKIVSTLSGGEKARLALAKLMLLKANFLILDEPTNHLDLDSKEVLENALIDYPGTLLFVSHDRYFMNRIATKILELSATGTQLYLGDYDYFTEKKLEEEELRKLAELDATAKQVQEAPTTKHSFQQDKEAKKLERQRQRKIEEIERNIEATEENIATLEEQLCDPNVFQDHELVQKLNAEVEQHKANLLDFMEQWEQLHE